MSSKLMLHQIVNLLHEVGMLSNIARSGFAFLGTGRQSVAEHSFRVALTAFALASIVEKSIEKKGDTSFDSLESAACHPPIDMHKLVMMCLLHDLPEARIGDLNYVQKKYVIPRLDRALEEIESNSILGSQIAAWIQEYEEGASLEAQLAKDADQLELLLVLKGEEEKGNSKAKDWMIPLFKRLKTEVGKKVAQTISETATDEWWSVDKSDPHRIDGDKNTSLKSD